MKAICMPQPWASMLCAGLQDVLSMAWKPETNPGKLLIVATTNQVPLNYHEVLPSAWSYRLDNFLSMGQLPPLATLPKHSIVGCVEIGGFTAEEESIWSLPECWSWKITSAQSFAQPMPFDSAGKQFVFDIDEVSEDSLPATRPVQQPVFEDGVLTLPVNSAKFDSLLDGDRELDLNIYEENRDTFTTHEGTIWTPRKASQALFKSADGREARFELEGQLLKMDYDDNNQPIRIEKVGGSMEFLFYMLLTLGKRIDG